MPLSKTGTLIQANALQILVPAPTWRHRKLKTKTKKKKTGQAIKARPLISTDNEKIETNYIYKYKKNKTKQLWCFPYSVFFLELQL